MKIKTFASFKKVPSNYTGKCKIFSHNSIYHYKDGKLHKEDGPAIECASGRKEWLLNGLHHREDGPAIDLPDGRKSWCYKNIYYGSDNAFTNKTWKEKVKELKREEELKIFI